MCAKKKFTVEERRERHRLQKKQWALDNPKIQKLTKWKSLGLEDDFEYVYKRYVETKKCDLCHVPFGKKGDKTGTYKCMDHDHSKLTYNFRNIVCQVCNTFRDKPLPKSGYRNIYRCKNYWRCKWYNPDHEKAFKCKYDAITYKYFYDNGYKIIW